jgi:hypothetical protein
MEPPQDSSRFILNFCSMKKEREIDIEEGEENG